MRRLIGGAIWLAVGGGSLHAAAPVEKWSVQPVGWNPVLHIGAAGLSIRTETFAAFRPYLLRISTKPAALRWDGKARFAFPLGPDQAGIALSGSSRRARSPESGQSFRSYSARSIAAALGWWADDGAFEIGIFQDQGGSQINPLARTVQLASGRKLSASGVKLSASLYDQPDPGLGGWSLSIDARRQDMTDVDAALRGQRARTGDSRIALSGRLRF